MYHLHMQVTMGDALVTLDGLRPERIRRLSATLIVIHEL